MKISGFQKLTLLDFPGKTACTVFTSGCNLRCPFCHNSMLVIAPPSSEQFSEDEILSYLQKRKGLIDGVCITGGEPMIMKDLPDFCIKLKEMDLSVKIDTNGFFPSQLKYIVNNGLCDYVAMDVKNSLRKYPETVGVSNIDISKPLESINFLKENKVKHEFRTTLCKPFHTKDDVLSIAELLGENETYYLQNFVDSGALIGNNVSGFTPSEMREFWENARTIVKKVTLRGIET